MDLTVRLLLWLLISSSALAAHTAPISALRLAPFIDNERLLDSDQVQQAATILPDLQGRQLLTSDRPVRLAGTLVPQQLYDVYRPLVKLKDRYQGHELGQKLQRLGTIKVDNSHANISTAHIMTQQQELRAGDKALPRATEKAGPPTYYPKPGPSLTQAYILSLTGQASMVGAGGVVFINKGRHHGLSLGDVYGVARADHLGSPPLEVGRIMVFQLEKLTSWAWVLSAQQEIRLQDSLFVPEQTLTVASPPNVVHRTETVTKRGW